MKLTINTTIQMLVFEERGIPEYPEKTSRCREENQQTQPTYDAGSRNRTWATLVGGDIVDDVVDCAAKADEVEGESVDFLELGGYVAKESIEDVKTGPNLTDEQRNEFTDLAKQFTNLFTEAPDATDVVQHYI